ncbi:LPS assembly lipoprotein LptE [Marinomonas mediterranea]|uniref:LPS-assembly lipoprotein LptE n=1 Tax=Marinomonas mediterranea TaxID=119864 RepID=UPI00234A1D1D|nr:LPS assembly lipoprotein LptE [Marinomonas mediterranea]WCN10219.1 hypothetical protein GV055_15530 [Marinomonas mediterranea]
MRTFNWLAMNGKFTILVALVALTVSACGFHLRGQTPLPERVKTLILTSQSGSANFDRTLRSELAKAGVTLVSKDDTSADLKDILELKVNTLASSDTVLARNSTTNDVTQIQRTLSSSYFIRDESGQSLYGPRNIETSSVLTNQDAEESTKSAYNIQEMERLSEQLAKQLVYDLAYAPL